MKRGSIAVVAAVERFEAAEVVLADGRRTAQDAVIAATGYATGLESLVGHLGVIDENGEPIARSPPAGPGLFFAGFRFGLAALLPYIRLDAASIGRQASRVARDRRPASRSQPRS